MGNDQFIKKVDNGNTDSKENTGNQQLDPKGQQESSQGHGRNEEVATVLRGNGQADSGTFQNTWTSKSEQETALKEYAVQNGIWFNENQLAEKISKNLPSGKEADVYVDKSYCNVIKVVKYQLYSNTPTDFLNNRIFLYNYLFNESPYEIIGFTQNEKGFSFIVEQPFVKGSLLQYFTSSETDLDNLQNRVKDYMKERFDMNPAGLDAFANELYTIQDVHLKNVILGADDNLYFIDVIPSLKISERELQQ